MTETPTLVDKLLAEQRQLTAVERFSRAHDTPGDLPAQARYYSALIPLEKPRPGEQYGFSVDLDSCTGCKACVSACHSLNGLDEHETWRSTGLLHGGTLSEPYQQVVTTACHHCVDPACLNGCPVLAYEKDPVTGIVRHLDDQCIGCQYCVLKCPYDVPQYSASRGIVRKCDLCHSRLAADEAPACVQACPNGAISVRIISKAATAQQCSEPDQRLLPGTVLSAYTQPATVYSSRRPFPANVQPADADLPRGQPAHWPLIWMLLLTQLAAGLSLLACVLGLLRPQLLHFQGAFAVCSCVLLQAGLASSVFHLGRPRGAWRSFLGWRRSWMSREILAFGGCAGAMMVWTLAACSHAAPGWILTLNSGAAGLGLAAVFCSAMIYIDTRRPFWAARRALPRFLGATLLLGAAGGAVLLSSLSHFAGTGANGAAQLAGWAATAIRTALFIWEGNELMRGLASPVHAAHRSARFVWHRRRSLVWTRLALFICATGCGVLALGQNGLGAVVLTSAAFLATFAAAVIERYVFFVAVTAPKMPGGVAP